MKMTPPATSRDSVSAPEDGAPRPSPTGSERPLRLVVVGGVAGGMSCAARARRLSEDAEIIVLDRGQHVSFANCGLPYYVGGEIEDQDDLLVQTPERLRAWLNLDARTGHDVTGIDPTAREVIVSTAAGEQRIRYDALVLAPGAKAARPPVDGLDSPRVSTLRTVEDAVRLREWADAGAKSAVVLGAGFIGIEAAEVLAKRGIATTVVEFAEHVLPPLEREHAYPITQELRRLGIDVRTGTAAQSIIHGADADEVLLTDGTRVQADLVVLATGVRPDTYAFVSSGLELERGAIVVDDHGRTNLPHVYAVGDATVSTDPVTRARRPVPLAGPANRAGRLVADFIMDPAHARPIPAPLGTAIVRVGKMTAAMTGANRAALDAAGIEYTTIHLHPNQHAGYFPGATQLHLSVSFTPDGRILGAQCVGRDGVDKRIDVLATAIRAGLGVADLIDLDLAYAPPFGQAKDPVNLAGMLGSNVLNRSVEVWDVRDLEQVRRTHLLLDVRTRAEVARGMVPGALNIPHTELRGRIDEVRQAAADRPIGVICQVGVRANIAHRILVGNGLKSSVLTGGMITLRAWLGDDADSFLVGA
ncbi:FAD-dependent oxidoreductase [Actinomyces sp. 594]|uniref:FAD-dependent oxidoreductase n=1 Tax=Actinomyces sp. 594 TaxID=2057793 RepID=UPI00214BF8D1|nr:FAD-dependent oxidoreductase [Actinomyces sp. 594]